MKHFTTPMFIALLILIIPIKSIIAQGEKDFCLNIRTEKFVVGMDNPLVISYPQQKPIVKEDIRVEFTHWESRNTYPLKIYSKNGDLWVRPDSVGSLKVYVNTVDGVKSRRFRTKVITAVGRLSRYKGRHDGKIRVGEMKVQQGILASIENMDICGSCMVQSFETIRIPKFGTAQRAVNKGGRFTAETREILDQTMSGDVYCFRKIEYKCPGSKYALRLEDMTFDIK